MALMALADGTTFGGKWVDMAGKSNLRREILAGNFCLFWREPVS